MIIEEDNMKKITEGLATIVFQHDKEAFYNEVQVLNRDISTLAIKTFDQIRRQEDKEKHQKRIKAALAREEKEAKAAEEAGEEYVKKELDPKVARFRMGSQELQEKGPDTEDLRIMEALSATGLRSIRYAKEIPDIGKIIANDIDPTAVEAIERNVLYNGLSTDVVVPNCDDAAMAMYKSKGFLDQFHVVDLDPYGTAAPFLDSAVQSIRNGGLLCVTCTDATVLCGNAPEVGYSNYGSTTIKAQHCHETALRIMLSAIQRHASIQKRIIEPVLSLSLNFYFRVFVRVHESAARVKDVPTNSALIYQCTKCPSFYLQSLGRKVSKGKGVNYLPGSGPSFDARRCSECGGSFQVGGPIWTAPIHDHDFVQRMMDSVENDPSNFATAEQIKGTLLLVKEELPDVPLYAAREARREWE
eukprot:TRINITY_DN794_c0_g2_i4.p1 TRINITY_DN794_c0_g2~~TRINITY_DN794_c0_g2_i4.p1  ORF type:complete len:423 (+),score=141.49 TRINITY_DN794_c0_g2_i4:26-1270(+)